MPGKRRQRKNLSVKLSYDESKTWPVQRTLEAGPSAGRPRNGYYLTLARFNVDWLTEGQDSLGGKAEYTPRGMDRSC